MRHAKSIQLKNVEPIRWSKRQREVIETWGKTLDPAATADQLQISVNTVLTHLRRMREKLHCSKTMQVWLHFQDMGSGGGLRRSAARRRRRVENIL